MVQFLQDIKEKHPQLERLIDSMISAQGALQITPEYFEVYQSTPVGYGTKSKLINAVFEHSSDVQFYALFAQHLTNHPNSPLKNLQEIGPMIFHAP